VRERQREGEGGISKWLVWKIEDIYAKTKNKVKVGEKEGEWFETTKGVRQEECKCKRNERNYEEPGKVCEEEKAGK
jgi:hypothetical protein